MLVISQDIVSMQPCSHADDITGHCQCVNSLVPMLVISQDIVSVHPCSHAGVITGHCQCTAFSHAGDITGHCQCANRLVLMLVISQDVDVKNLNLCTINYQSNRNKPDHLVNHITEQDFGIMVMWQRHGSGQMMKIRWLWVILHLQNINSIPRKGHRSGGVAKILSMCLIYVIKLSLIAAITTEIGIIRLGAI